jgi:Ca-activated chloride channel family protein
MIGSPGFDHPWVLLAFTAFIPLLVLEFFRGRESWRAASLFAPPSRAGEKDTFAREFRFRCLGSGLCFFLFLASMILALAGPRWGSRRTLTYSRGLDLILALDLSHSMEVQDSLPYSPPGKAAGKAPVSRLERGLSMAEDLLNRTGGIRTGAVIGRGRGILALPLTYDTGGAVSFLESLRGRVLTGTGTNLEALIDTAAASFQDAFPGRRVIILFSDGEALSGSLAAALDRAREAGIALSFLGLGSDEGGPVPRGEPEEGELPGDERAQDVFSFRRSEFLRDAAARSGGLYLDGNRDEAVKALGEYLFSLSSGFGPGSSRREPGAWWHVFAIAGLVFWGCSRFLGLKLRPGRAGTNG